MNDIARRFSALVISLILLAGCGARTATAPAHSVGVNVSGLDGTLTLKSEFSAETPVAPASGKAAAPGGLANPIAQNLTLTADGAYAFARPPPSGTRYRVTVLSQPEKQICAVTDGGSRVVGTNDVSTIRVTCRSKSGTTFKAMTALDTSVPGAIAAKIAKVVSTAASASLGAPLEVSAAPAGGETFVYAVDVADNVVLAAPVSDSQVILSADSTALTLSRVLLGALPSNVKPMNVDAAIRAAAAFPALVARINAALAAGISPLASNEVFDMLNTVTAQISPAILARAAAVESATAAPGGKANVTATVATASLNAQRLVSWRGSDVQAVFLVGADGAKASKLSNHMSIAWAAASTDDYGNRICPLGNGRVSRCGVLLPVSGTTGQTAGGATQSAPDLLTDVSAGSAGRAIKLTLSQDDESRKANMMRIVDDGVAFALGAVTEANNKAVPANCARDLSALMLPEEQLRALAANRASVNFLKYLDTVGIGATVESALAEKLAECFGGASASTNNVPAFSRITLIFYRQFGLWATRNIATTVNASNIGLETGLTLYYWNDAGTTARVLNGRITSAAGKGRQ